MKNKRLKISVIGAIFLFGVPSTFIHAFDPFDSSSVIKAAAKIAPAALVATMATGATVAGVVGVGVGVGGLKSYDKAKDYCDKNKKFESYSLTRYSIIGASTIAGSVVGGCAAGGGACGLMGLGGLLCVSPRRKAIASGTKAGSVLVPVSYLVYQELHKHQQKDEPENELK